LLNGKTLYTVCKASVDTSNRRTPDSCDPNEEALSLKRDFLSSFFPDYEVLGNFHTHPYAMTGKTVKLKKLYHASPADKKMMKDEDKIKFNFRLFL